MKKGLIPRSFRWTPAVIFVWAAAATVLPALADPPAAMSLADLKALERAFVDAADRVRPSVVAIRTYDLRRGSDREDAPRFRSPRLQENQGSGFIVSADGYIVTNNHVVAHADEIIAVLHDGFDEPARLVQSDERNDIAVIKIERDHLRAISAAQAADLRVGQWTLAVGNPFGLAEFDGQTSVTIGTISAIGRDMTGPLTNYRSDGTDRYYGSLIETSATINPGNSGGPLFNLDGQVIGIITAIETRSGVSEGVGFAIPMDRYTLRIIETLKSGQKVRYGFLGVQVEPIDPRRFPTFGLTRGAIIRDVTKDEPADKAGLKTDDIIVEFDGESVEGPDHLVRLVGATPVGTPSRVTVVRDGKELTKTVVLADRRPPAAPQ